MLGNNRQTIVTKSIASPTVLEADHLDKRLFWLDSLREELQSVDYDGNDRNFIVRVPASTLFDFGIFRVSVSAMFKYFHNTYLCSTIQSC